MKLRFEKSVNKFGRIVFRVYVEGNEKETEILEKAWMRLETTETPDGLAIELNDKYIHRAKSTDENAFTAIYALNEQMEDVDVTKEDLDELVELLREEIEELEKEETYEYTL